jgi:hypothetical protein
MREMTRSCFETASSSAAGSVTSRDWAVVFLVLPMNCFALARVRQANDQSEHIQLKTRVPKQLGNTGSFQLGENIRLIWEFRDERRVRGKYRR